MPMIRKGQMNNAEENQMSFAQQFHALAGQIRQLYICSSKICVFVVNATEPAAA